MLCNVSNAQRIWIGYLFILGTPLMMFAAPAIATMLGVDETLAGAAGAIGIFISFGAWVIYFSQSGKCWRCRDHLSKGPAGWYYPIVFWRHCRACGVRHASRPDDVRRDPLGHFR